MTGGLFEKFGKYILQNISTGTSPNTAHTIKPYKPATGLKHLMHRITNPDQYYANKASHEMVKQEAYQLRAAAERNSRKAAVAAADAAEKARIEANQKQAAYEENLREEYGL
jgi:hypothetical protein